jgi:hypothetical protein
MERNTVDQVPDQRELGPDILGSIFEPLAPIQSRKIRRKKNNQKNKGTYGLPAHVKFEVRRRST